MTNRELKEKIKQAAAPTAIDSIISKFSPGWAAKRQRSKIMLALGGAFTGAKTDRRSLKEWVVPKGDADTDILWDLPVLRERCRELERNHPIAHGVIKTKCMNVIGPGLQLRARLDRDILNMNDDAADAWERKAQNEWKLFWRTQEVDISRISTGPELEWLAYKQTKVNGEVLVLFPRRQRPGSPYQTKIQVIESDRLHNKDNVTDKPELAGGVKKDSDGAPVEYHILKQHPGSLLGAIKKEWNIIPAFGGDTGLRNVLHIYRQERPGQTRGLPDFAAIIEPLKQLGRYTEAELDAAVISAFFTVFIKSENPENILGGDFSTSTDSTTDKDFKLGKGTIVGLNPLEDISTANPGRPNQNFDPFFQSIVQQISIALGLPHEIVMKRYLASYSAARTALLDAWKYFIGEREWFASKFHQRIYETFLYEAISTGRLLAPGYFSDPLITQAYNGTAWIGPSKGMINEGDEVEAAQKRVDMGITTLDEETAQLTGGDWEQKHPQRVKEKKQRIKDGLESPVENPQKNSGATDPDEQDEQDKKDKEEAQKQQAEFAAKIEERIDKGFQETEKKLGDAQAKNIDTINFMLDGQRDIKSQMSDISRATQEKELKIHIDNKPQDVNVNIKQSAIIEKKNIKKIGTMKRNKDGTISLEIVEEVVNE